MEHKACLHAQEYNFGVCRMVVILTNSSFSVGKTQAAPGPSAQAQDRHAWILHGCQQCVSQGQRDGQAGFKSFAHGCHAPCEECSPGHLQSHHQPHHHQQRCGSHQSQRGLSVPRRARGQALWSGLRAIQLHQQRQWHHSAQQQEQQQQQHQRAMPGPEAAQAGGQMHQQPPSSSSSLSSSAAAVQPSLLMRVLPPQAHPYAQLMRLDKPIGTWLLLWPCLWSIAMAAQPGHWPDPWTTFLFSLGAVLLRGSGCTINDLWDRDLDRRVERTRSRPLASGAVSPTQAVGLLAGQLSLGLVILLQLNDYSKVLGASSLALVGSYPLMKRITHWPQAYLGLTINWGALLGWAAVRGACDWSVVLPLYLAGTCWSLVYDTIYAHQDKRDDAVAGMGSTALLFGQKTDLVLLGFTTAQVALLTLAGGNAGMAWPYYVGVTGLASHLVWQIRTVDLNNGRDCMNTFISNKWAGGILFAGCVGGRLLST
ncbi:UbiA prenyltransferase family-domain-containing protein [Dunaliella salina]|uniref:4-hydroxybenzoate polyprenyltransferase, mitochondrial n=1 Tax=Dunaliella salina TaxID=3046 RepID=A0ABQ7GI16_DUNSA|nr:UbiA prenyltransferase family-domain-containing protein [Dunaliella salina]|eukprot:KAF5834249.1 UbiA prenyltransferase family-domain-containing protein [Dunaliella salina]